MRRQLTRAENAAEIRRRVDYPPTDHRIMFEEDQRDAVSRGIQLDRCDPECLRPRPRHPRKIDKRDATHVSLSHQGQARQAPQLQAQAINLIWNYCNETQMKAARDGRKWLSGYDLWKLVAGCTKQGLDLHSHSAMRVCFQYDKSRRQHRKPWLRWRSRRSLGWVPFSTGHVAHRDGGFVFRGERYEVWLHRPLPKGARIGAGSFSQDTRGRWYLNCPVKVSEGACLPGSRRWIRMVGIDLGLKDLATLSTGEKVEVPKFYRRCEERLATLQRSRKTKRAGAIHAKICNRRKYFLHKA